MNSARHGIVLLASLSIVLLTCGALNAQTPDTAAPPPVVTVDYGVRFGPSFTSLTSVEAFDPEVVARAFEPTMNFGGFVRIGLGGPLSVQPEVLFAARGHRIHDLDAEPVTSGGQVKRPAADRVILLRYLEVPVLLRLSRQTRPSTSLYVIAGPAFAFKRGAVIREVGNPEDAEDISASVASNNMSIVYGAGAQHHRWLVDARFAKGIRNVVTSPGATVKTGAFSVLMGIRF